MFLSLIRFSLNSNKNSLTFLSQPGFLPFLGAILLVFQACAPEGEQVNVYSSRHYQVDENLFDQFTEETGIEVNVVKGDADPLIQRLGREGENTPADLFFTVDLGRLHKAKEDDLLQPANEIDAEVPSYLKDPENYWLPITKRARIVLFHRDRVDSTHVEGYTSLTQEVFEDRVLMRSSRNVYNQSLLSALIQREGSDFALNWAEGMVDNFAREPTGNDRDQVAAVVAGDGDITIVNSYYLGLLRHSPEERKRELVDEVALHFPGEKLGGTHVNISGVGLTRHSSNKENALKLVDYLLEEEAQKAFMNENYEYPAVKGVDYEGILEEWGHFEEDKTPLHEVARKQSEAVSIFSEAGWR